MACYMDSLVHPSKPDDAEVRMFGSGFVKCTKKRPPSFRLAGLQDRWAGQAHSPHALRTRIIFDGDARGCRQDFHCRRKREGLQV